MVGVSILTEVVRGKLIYLLVKQWQVDTVTNVVNKISKVLNRLGEGYGD